MNEAEGSDDDDDDALLTPPLYDLFVFLSRL